MANVGSTRARNAVRQQAQRARRATAPRQAVDYATLLGVSGSFALIGVALYLGGSATTFFNLPGLLIVLFGTFMVTTVSVTFEEVLRVAAK